MSEQTLSSTTPKEETQAYNKVLYFLLSYPLQQFSLTDLVEELKIHKVTANKIVKKLEQEQVIKIETLGRIWRISVDQQHIYNISRKVPYHLQLIYENGLIEQILRDIPQAKNVVLFGSYRKGDDTEKSDIDLAIEVVDDAETKIINYGILKQFGYRKNVVVNIHIFSRNNITLNLFANIANGIVLEGFLEVRP